MEKKGRYGEGGRHGRKEMGRGRKKPCWKKVGIRGDGYGQKVGLGKEVGVEGKGVWVTKETVDRAVRDEGAGKGLGKH